MSVTISTSAVQAAGEVRVVFGRVKRRLKELADKDGPASASELAAAERVRPQSMAAILSALRAADLIERHPDPQDGRRQVVSLTTTGRHRLQGDRRVRQEWLAQALQDNCTEAERQTIVKALALLDTALEAAASR